LNRVGQGTICRLCDRAAPVRPVYAPDGSIRATARTDCPACGSWTISKRDSPLLDMESAETKRRISAKVHEQFKADPNNPPPVSEGLMLFCRHER
jgi:hypothetical protein